MSKSKKSLKDGDWVWARTSSNHFLQPGLDEITNGNKHLFRVVGSEHSEGFKLEYFCVFLEKVNYFILYQIEIDDPVKYKLIIDNDPKIPCDRCGCFCSQLCVKYVK